MDNLGLCVTPPNLGADDLGLFLCDITGPVFVWTILVYLLCDTTEPLCGQSWSIFVWHHRILVRKILVYLCVTSLDLSLRGQSWSIFVFARPAVRPLSITSETSDHGLLTLEADCLR